MRDEFITFDSDDLIYNRFDLIYQGRDIERFEYATEEGIFTINVHCRGNRATFDVWGKKFPEEVFLQAVCDMFDRHPEIDFLDIKRAGNQFLDVLEAQKDIRIQLPGSVEQLIGRLRKKSRATIRRNSRRLSEMYGDLRLELYHDRVSKEAVDQYFLWKKHSHNTEYNMSPEKYIKNYFVTDTLLLKAGTTNAAVLFLCHIGRIAYLENLAYNCALSRFSPGLLVYIRALEELIKRGCSYFYLGGGDYGYKTRFDAEVRTVYSGSIQRKDIIHEREG